MLPVLERLWRPAAAAELLRSTAQAGHHLVTYGPFIVRTAAAPPCLHAPRFFGSSSPAAASSNSRWTARQGRDQYAREAKVRGLKSRAAFKLLELDAKHRLFRPGQTVVDLVRGGGLTSFLLIAYDIPSAQTDPTLGLCSRQLVTGMSRDWGVYFPLMRRSS